MPIVFVHGVRTRPGETWERHRHARRTLFQRFALRGLVPDPGATYYDEPMWGHLGAAPRWNNAALPEGEHESFALEDDRDAAAAIALVEAGFEPVPRVPAHRQLVERTRLVAAQQRPEADRQPLEELLDVLLVMAFEEANPGQLVEATEFAVRAADYARHDPAPAWLPDVADDTELLNAFADAVDDWELQHEDAVTEAAGQLEEFGFAEFRDRFLEAGRRVGGVSGRLAGRAFTAATRARAHRAAAVFLGDVVVYLNRRGTRTAPGPIVRTVGDAIETARAAVKPGSDPKLVVVAHSMGGNIVYDVLTHFRPDLVVDVFFTVGSQVAFLEELKQFRVSSDAVPADPEVDRVQRPPNVKRWINVFDLNDVLGFAASGVFADVEDFAYSTGEGAIKAHGAYFTLPSFHDRLRERLREQW